MRVITLLNEDFVSACRNLANKIKDSFAPDVIISILTGGAYVGKIILKELDNKDILYAEITIQRGNTKRKELKIVHYIIRMIPKFIANWIRILESEMLLIKSKVKKPSRTGIIDFEKNIDEFLKIGCKNVLIVDDSIDSGATVELACSYISENYPNNIIRVAVIAVSTDRPLIDADYFLYHNRIQARFPWSHDA
jgi:hypoxanthine phosphoribosyltransferase